VKLTQSEIQKLIKEVIEEQNKKPRGWSEELWQNYLQTKKEVEAGGSSDERYARVQKQKQAFNPDAPIVDTQRMLDIYLNDPETFEEMGDWDDEMMADQAAYLADMGKKYAKEMKDPESHIDYRLGILFVPGGLIDLRKEYPNLFPKTPLRAEYEEKGSLSKTPGDPGDVTGTMPGFKSPKKSKWQSFKDNVTSVTSKFGRSGNEDATKPGFGNRHESVEKLTPEILRELIKETIISEWKDSTPSASDSNEWSSDNWIKLLMTILEEKNLTTDVLASPNNVQKVAAYLSQNNITPDHFKKSKMGSNYLDRRTLEKAGWPIQQGGNADVATVVSMVLEDPL
jgi:hypothetical protein